MVSPAECNSVTRFRVTLLKYYPMDMISETERKKLLQHLRLSVKDSPDEARDRISIGCNMVVALLQRKYWVRPAEIIFLTYCLWVLHSELGWYPRVVEVAEKKLHEFGWPYVEPPHLDPLQPDGQLPESRLRQLMPQIPKNTNLPSQ